ncbi:hypothetical protein ACQB60_08675 [Actinomycetota bacterium Odt1-20B]
MRTSTAATALAPLTCLALLGLAAAPAYAGDAAAEVSPRTIAPGGTVTISVACPAAGSSPPRTIEANSQAFEQGAAQLHLVDNANDDIAGPAYNGTARIAPAGNFEGGPNAVGATSDWGVDGNCPGDGQWNASFTVSRSTPVRHGVHAGEGGSFTDSRTALITGGVLIAGVMGAAALRLRRGVNQDS